MAEVGAPAVGQPTVASAQTVASADVASGNVARLLESLHPLREPPPPAPVTPTLVMAALGCVAALSLFTAWWQARRRRTGFRRSAEVALAASRALPPADRLAAQAALLRRIVRARAGDAAARAQGQAWLQCLDRVFATRFFTQGDGTAYGGALYGRRASADVEALDRALRGLLARLVPPRPRDRSPA